MGTDSNKFVRIRSEGRGSVGKQLVLRIGVRAGILLGERKKFALKITICIQSNFFSLMRMGPETSS